MTTPPRPPWWKGERGEWLVAAQFALMLLVLLGPRSLPGLPGWTLPSYEFGRWLGAGFVLGGGALSAVGSLRLGSGLTPLPFPKDGAPFVQSGPYAVVRHPIYSGLLIGSAGIALLASGWLTWVYAAALFTLFDVKTRHEERWLSSKFPEYASYQRRVRKLLPFLY
jgi:protein-S-isoprenylcysteine O-methyltransferase Ste14